MDQAATADRQDPQQVSSNDLPSASDLSWEKRLQWRIRLLRNENRCQFKQLADRLKELEDLNSNQRCMTSNEYSKTGASTSHAPNHEKILGNPSRSPLLSRTSCRLLQLPAIYVSGGVVSTSKVQHTEKALNTPSSFSGLHCGSLQLPKRCSMFKRLEMRIAALEESSLKNCDVLSCKICGCKTTNADRMKWHMENDHASEKERQCLLCSETFATYASLRQHLKIHRYTISARSMSYFLSKSGNRNKYLEEMKSRLESSPSSRSTHKKSPDTPGCKNKTPSLILFDCEYCIAKFREAYELQRHFVTVHRCIETGKLFKSCKLCLKVYYSETEFIDHLSTIHKISVRISEHFVEDKMKLHNENRSTDELIIDPPVVNDQNIPHHNNSLNLQSVCSDLSRLHLLP